MTVSTVARSAPNRHKGYTAMAMCSTKYVACVSATVIHLYGSAFRHVIPMQNKIIVNGLRKA